MEYSDLKKFIADQGYRTISEIKERFSKEDPEVLMSNLDYLVSKNMVRKIKFQRLSLERTEEIFYIPGT